MMNGIFIFRILLIQHVFSKFSVSEIQETFKDAVVKHKQGQDILKSSIINPIFGYLLESTGTLNNLRFFNPGITVLNEADLRNFPNDIGEDPFTCILIKMFPSTGGILNHIRNRPTNFGNKFKMEKQEGINFLSEIFSRILKTKENSSGSETKFNKSFRELEGLFMNHDDPFNIFDVRLLKLMTIHAFALNALSEKADLKSYLEKIIEKLDNFEVKTYEFNCDVFQKVLEVEKKYKNFPYSLFNQPPSNDLIPVFDRSKKDEENPFIESMKFSDCADVLLLNICNCLFFDPNNSLYSTSTLDPNSDLSKFYQKHSKQFIITEEIRKEWSRVIQGLDDFEVVKDSIFKTHQIVYLKDKRNELKSGIINMMNALIKICEIDHKQFWADFDGTNIEDKLQELFEEITPEFANREMEICMISSKFKPFKFLNRTDFEGSFKLEFNYTNGTEITVEVQIIHYHSKMELTNYYNPSLEDEKEIDTSLFPNALPALLFKKYLEISQGFDCDEGDMKNRIFFNGCIATNEQKVIKLTEILNYIVDNQDFIDVGQHSISIANLKKITRAIISSVNLCDEGTRKIFMPFLVYENDLDESFIIESWIKSFEIEDTQIHKLWHNRIIELKSESMELDISEILPEKTKPLFNTLKKCQNLKSLHLKNISDDNQDIVLNKIRKLTRLNELNLSDNNLSFEGALHLSESLKYLTNLTNLNLSENDFCIEGCKCLSKALEKLTKLTVLNLSDNGFESEGIKILFDSLQNLKLLTNLNLSKNMIMAEGAEYVSKLIKRLSLVSLNLSGNILQEKGIQIISEALKKTPALSTLDISFNSLKLNGAKAISQVIPNLKNLTTLEISCNSLGTEGTKILLESLVDLPNFKNIDLENNFLKKDSIEQIPEILEKLTNLTSLNLSSNHLNEDDGVKISKALAKLTKLKDLNVSKNNLKTKGTEAISLAMDGLAELDTINFSDNQINSIAAVNIANMLWHHPNIKKLDISSNIIDAEGAKEISKSLENAASLTYLDMSNNSICSSGAQSIIEVLEKWKSLRFLRLSGNQIEVNEKSLILEVIRKKLKDQDIQHDISFEEIAVVEKDVVEFESDS